MPINYVDIAIAIALLCFIYRGFTNGFLREFSAIIGVVGGFFLAGIYALNLAVYLNAYISSPVAYPIAFIAIIVLTMLAVSVLTRIINSLLRITFAGWIDHLLGAFLGLTNGIILTCVVIYVVTSLASDSITLLQDSIFLPYYDLIMEFIGNFLRTNYMSYPIAPGA